MPSDTIGIVHAVAAPTPFPPAADAYLTAFNAWLAAGADRRDLLVDDLLQACGHHVRAQLAPRPRTPQTLALEREIRPLLELL